MLKKGLAVIYDPHNLYQFVWYYCNKGKQKKWDALCLPNGYKGEYMHSFCEDANIFEKIYKDDTDFSALPSVKKFKLFLQMVLYFVIGRRASLCRKILKKYVDLCDYNELVVIADVGIVSGACVALGKEMDVVILEDGINDYGERLSIIPKSKWKSSYAWQGFFLSIMGYCSPGWFKLKTDKHCIKYCSQPSKMQYRNYKEIRLLYSDEGTDHRLLDQIIRRIYHAINNYDFNSINAVIMTRPLDDLVVDIEKYVQRLNAYVSDKYKTVLLKKHPRELSSYDFGSSTMVIEVDNALPAEALFPYLKGKDILIVTTSSILIYFESYNLHGKIIVFDGMYEENVNSNVAGRALSTEEVKEFLEKFCGNRCELIHI